MNKEWLKVYIAAIFEVGWVSGLKHADTPLTWFLTIVAIGISFYVFIAAGKKLPMGTVYAVFVGLGTAGTVIGEIIFFHEPIVISKLIFILFLLIGVIGLKFVTEEPVSERADM